MAKYQVIIGRAENIDFVGTSLGVPAKIDTGAFRSSVHASNIIETTNKEGESLLKFELFGHPHAPVKRLQETTRYEKTSVRSSNGAVEQRYEVTLKIKIGPKIFDTSFNLADRSHNVYPVLVGRKALKNRFMIDTAKTSVKRSNLIREFGVMTVDSEEDLED